MKQTRTVSVTLRDLEGRTLFFSAAVEDARRAGACRDAGGSESQAASVLAGDSFVGEHPPLLISGALARDLSGERTPPPRVEKPVGAIVHSPEWLDWVFAYHPPSDAERLAYEQLRRSAKQFATDIVALTPACADRAAALRLVREAVMTANAAIALQGAV